ncbi:NtaA/DmoA family FMN-dependent monooxygenase [Protaetiibacter larvae]|uniref:NtaA/DmoA family FMN-dependent monooxygenase n=1 Tax=Protaetiibacter larvae TaxID=2592654 RepID=A0A5C1Y6M4_9MICO|nr:NtaA/DmoA family FMN-dependent monooxygenase [Protaetiibacter larvae]QEO09451.1 NtaA/DmoA family FMN-dependent monooxygenase [Protaetiibacter larvae]
MTKKQLRLGLAAYGTGWDNEAWRLPESVDVGLSDPSVILDIARIAERGKFDYIFAGSAIASEPNRWGRIYRWDSAVFGGYAAAQTKNVGFLLTYNTSFEHPYFVARQLATLDNFSGGRVAFNAVTGIDRAADTGGPTANFENWPLPDDDSKYTRVVEFTEVLNQLLYSWDADYLLDDKAGGQLVRPGSYHPIDYRGEHFVVQGPLNVARPIQNTIPNVHVGTSERSVSYGAEFAHARFAPYLGHDRARQEYKDHKARIAASGRDPEKFKILPGITFYIGGTAREAREKFRQVQAFTQAVDAPARIGAAFGVDLSEVKPTEKFFNVIDIEKVGFDTLKAILPEGAGRRREGTPRPGDDDRQWLQDVVVGNLGEDVTLEDVYQFVVRHRSGQGKLVGDAKHFADFLEQGLEEEAFDGVQFFPPYHRGPADLLVDLVVPELQRRGIFRKEYEGSTLEQNLGIA